MKLKDMVELLSNNDACVVLKVKDGQEMNLISLGCFNGDEAVSYTHLNEAEVFRPWRAGGQRQAAIPKRWRVCSDLHTGEDGQL